MERIQQDVMKILQTLGWQAFTDDVRKVTGFQQFGETIYIKNNNAHKIDVVFDPSTYDRILRIENISGVIVPGNGVFDHLSNYRRFPKRQNHGKSETHYGVAVTFSELSKLRVFFNKFGSAASTAILEELVQIDLDETATTTERQVLRQARIGQGKFRENLLEEFDSKCPLTGIAMSDILVASHIKPWRSSNNVERLDPKNGILLAANVDALFDKGYIGFSGVGEVLFSPSFPNTEIRKFNIPSTFSGLKFCKTRSDFLDYHRKHVFKSGQ